MSTATGVMDDDLPIPEDLVLGAVSTVDGAASAQVCSRRGAMAAMTPMTTKASDGTPSAYISVRRLLILDRTWLVTQLRPSRPGPAAVPEPLLVRRIIGHSQIHLPPAGRADVLAGACARKG
jgi:hypothetical protein